MFTIKINRKVYRFAEKDSAIKFKDAILDAIAGQYPEYLGMDTSEIADSIYRSRRFYTRLSELFAELDSEH
jgi:hypothetical protein